MNVHLKFLREMKDFGLTHKSKWHLAAWSNYRGLYLAHVRFSQAELATGISLALETIRHWAQGQRSLTGAPKLLLKFLDQAPKVAQAALH